MKADRNVFRRQITSNETGAGQLICNLNWNMTFFQPPVSLAVLNGILLTGNKSELANVVTEDTDCPETIQFCATSSFLIIDG